MELLYTDDIVLMAETEELLVEKNQKWEKSIEWKAFRVHLCQTKFIKYEARFRPTEHLGKWPWSSQERSKFEFK